MWHFCRYTFQLLGPLIAATLLCGTTPSHAQILQASKCKQIESLNDVQISAAAIKDLAEIEITPDGIFQSIKDVSTPETRGCWSGATGNFDNQLVSVGFAQWNLGQGTLQSLLLAYKRKFDGKQLQERLSEVAPLFGRLLFSDGCLRRKVTADCKEWVLAAQDASRRLFPDFEREINAIFEDELMIQIQVDHFVSMLTSVKSDLKRLFPKSVPTPRQIKWAIDTKVQQGQFPGDADVVRMRELQMQMGSSIKKERLLGLVKWYEGLAGAVDQDGIRLDWKWNVDRWRSKIQTSDLSDEQIDLLHLTFLRSRVATGDSGRWQALTFQRRATIVLGVGSLSGRRIGPS
jgi:hypothetical protein